MHISNDVTNMMILQAVYGGPALLLPLNNMRFTQNTQVVRGKRLGDTPSTKCSFANAVWALHKMMGNS